MIAIEYSPTCGATATTSAPLVRADVALRAPLLGMASHLEYRLDRYAAAMATAALARAGAAHTRDRATRLQALTVLASCALRLGRLADARRHFKQALALASADASGHYSAATLDNLALVERMMGRYDTSLRLSIESLAQHRRIGDAASVAQCLNNLACVYLAKGEFGATAAHLREALEISERDGLVNTRSLVLTNLTEVAMKSGDLAAAGAHATIALELANATGSRGVVAMLNLQTALLALRRADLATARTALADGVSLAIRLGSATHRAGGLQVFAELLDAQGESTCARRVLAFALGHPSITAADRDELRGAHARFAVPAQPDSPWPGIELDELLHRIVIEREVAFAPLIGALQGPG